MPPEKPPPEKPPARQPDPPYGAPLLQLVGAEFRIRDNPEHQEAREQAKRARDLPPERLGPIHMTLMENRRYGVRAANPVLWNTLVDALTGQGMRVQGQLIEPRPLRAQTDTRLWEMMRPNDTLQNWLKGPEAPLHVWLGQRRRSIGVLVDQLGLGAQQSRTPIKLMGDVVRNRIWCLRFIVSQADLLIGRDIFALEDETIRAALHRRWEDFPGTLLVGLPEGVGADIMKDLGRLDGLIDILPDGAVKMRMRKEEQPGP